MNDQDEGLMQQALALADQAAALGEVPVGAVAALDGVVVGRGLNRRETDRDPFAHAELLALSEAARTLGRWRLSGVSLVVTLEPCSLCVGAALQARVERVVYGAPSSKAWLVAVLIAAIVTASATMVCRSRLSHGLLMNR
jgi:tRNA(adenine34) deaminase